MYENILTFKTIEDFPKNMHKPYINNALKLIEDKIEILNIEFYQARGEYKNYIESELKKYDEFKKFLTDKLQKIYNEEFKKATKQSPVETPKIEIDQDNNIIDIKEDDPIEEKPKKRSYRRKSKKSEEGESK